MRVLLYSFLISITLCLCLLQLLVTTSNASSFLAEIIRQAEQQKQQQPKEISWHNENGREVGFGIGEPKIISTHYIPSAISKNAEELKHQLEGLQDVELSPEEIENVVGKAFLQKQGVASYMTVFVQSTNSVFMSALNLKLEKVNGGNEVRMEGSSVEAMVSVYSKYKVLR